MRAGFTCCRHASVALRSRCSLGSHWPYFSRSEGGVSGCVGDAVAAAWAANGMQRRSRVVRGGVRRVAAAVKTGSIGRAGQIRFPAGVDHIENRMARWSFVVIALPTFAALFLQAPLMRER